MRIFSEDPVKKAARLARRKEATEKAKNRFAEIRETEARQKEERRASLDKAKDDLKESLRENNEMLIAAWRK